MAEPGGVPEPPFSPYVRRLGDVPNAAQPVLYDGVPLVATPTGGLVGRIGAAWRETMVGALQNTPTGPTYVESGFDAVAAANQLAIAQDDRLILSTARSQAEFDVLLQFSMQRRRDRAIAAQEPLTHLLFNVGLDPSTYLFTGAAWVRAAPTFMRGVARAGSYQGMITGVTELGRNMADPTIPQGESVTATIGSAVIGGLIGSQARITAASSQAIGRFVNGRRMNVADLARGEGSAIIRPHALPGEITEDMADVWARARARGATTAEAEAAVQQAELRAGRKPQPPPPPGAARPVGHPEALPTDVPPTIGRIPQGDDWGAVPGDRTRGQGSRVGDVPGERASTTAAREEAQGITGQTRTQLDSAARADIQKALSSMSDEQLAALSPDAKAWMAAHGIEPRTGSIAERVVGAVERAVSAADRELNRLSEKAFWTVIDKISEHRKGKLAATVPPVAPAPAPRAPPGAAAPVAPAVATAPAAAAAAAAPITPTHAGAAATPGARVGQSGEFQPVATNTWLERLRMSPMARLISSPIDAVGRAVSHLTEIPYLVRRNLRGIENPGNVKSDQYKWQGRLAGVIQDYNAAYNDYRGVGRVQSAVQDITRQRPATMLSPGEFDARVWRRLHGTTDDVIPEINKAAKGMRELYDEMGDEAAKHKFFDPATVRQEKVWQTTHGEVRERYVNRIWNINAIKNNLAKFTKDVEDWLGVSGGDVTKAKEIVDSILTDRPFRAIDDEHVGKASSSYKRTFNAPSTVFERWMANDPQELLQHYVRTMGTDISLTARAGSVSAQALIDDATEEWFRDIGRRSGGRNGQFAFADMQTRLKGLSKQINGEYAALNKQFADHPPLEEIAKIRAAGLAEKNGIMQEAKRQLRASDKDWKAMLQDLSDIKDTRDLLRGTYGQWDESMDWVPRTLAAARKVAAMSSLTGVVSQLSDIGALVLKEGFTRTFGTAVSALSGGMATIKMGVKEAQLAGTALDMLNSSRVVSMMDLSSDVAGRHNMFERILDRATQTSMYLNLMNPWSTFMKGWAGLVVGSRIADDIAAVAAGGGGREMARLARAGIGPDMAQEIQDQLSRHATRGNGIVLPNTERWTSKEAREAYRRALAEDVENAVVSGDATSRSLYLSRPVGQTIGMFHGYGQAVLAKLVIPALQAGDTRLLSGAALMVGAGMISDSLRRTATGQNQEISYSEHLMRGVDRSGVTGWFGQLYSAASSLGDVRFGPGAAGAPQQPGANMPMSMTGGDGLVRLFGPAASSTANLVRLGFDTATLSWDQSTARDARRLLPLNNVTHYFGAFDTLERLLGSSGRQAPSDARLARPGRAPSHDQRLTMAAMQQPAS